MTMIPWKAYLMAARPRTLPAALASVVLGGFLAYVMNQFRFWPLFAAFTGAMLIQIGTNYANDYFDFIKGKDTAERIGPRRATASGLIPPESMKKAFILVFALSVLPGIFLVYEGGWPILVIGVLSILSGIAYTGGPYPLGYHGWGDFFVLVFFGPVAVCGTYYVSALNWNWYVFYMSFAPGLISVAILTVNNFRDKMTDTKTGKRTLAVRYGDQFSRMEYLGALTLAGMVPSLAFFLSGGINYPGSLAVIYLIAAFRPVKNVLFFQPMENNLDMNKVLAATGGLQIVFTAVFMAVTLAGLYLRR